MLLINCKVELKFKWTKYCVLSANGNDNDDAICNNIILTTKDSKLYVPILTLSAKGNQKLTKIMGKGLERSVYQNEYTTKSANNNRTNKYRFFSNQSLKELTHCLFQFVQMKIIIQKGIKTNNIIFQNALLKNRKNFYEQLVDSDVKQYKKIRKLTRGQYDDYTAACLLDYEYIKNHYGLVTGNFSRQIE